MRWPLPGQGKSGGLRVYYFWDGATETFFMLHAHAKAEREALTTQQVAILGRLIQEEFG